MSAERSPITAMRRPARLRKDTSYSHDGSRPSTPWELNASTNGASPWHISSMVSSQRSEEHTSELQSHVNLVCRLLLEKKKNKKKKQTEQTDKESERNSQ